MNTTLPHRSAPQFADRLALFGGHRAVNDPDLIAYRWPVFRESEKDAVRDMMNLTSAGEYYAEMEDFERNLCAYFDCKYALSLTNGTSALHSALFGADIRAGDEVITISYTYWATVLALRLVGAVPVFADVLESTGNIDPADIERKITPRTKAIMLVHLWGMPCEMDAIMAIADEHGLQVIEDCAHAHGAEFRGKKVGTFGSAGCFSMQGSKNMPAIEGGFLLTNNFDVYARACALGHYGRVPAAHPFHIFNATGLGYKYRIHPLAARIGNHRLATLEERNILVEGRVNRLFEGIAGLPGLEFFECPPDIKRVFYQAELKYNEAVAGVPVETALKALNAEGAFVVYERYPLQHQQEIYRDPSLWCTLPTLPDSLPATERLHEQVLQLPTFPACSDDLVDQYIAAFRKVWASFDALRREEPAAA